MIDPHIFHTDVPYGWTLQMHLWYIDSVEYDISFYGNREINSQSTDNIWYTISDFERHMRYGILML